MKKLIISMSCILLLQAAHATRGCKLNQFGQNICTDEYALYKPSEDKAGQAVRVLEHKISFKTLVKLNAKTYSVSRNHLIGASPCDGSSPICRNSEAKIIGKCNMITNKPVAIIEVFENDLVLIETPKENRYLYHKNCLRTI